MPDQTLTLHGKSHSPQGHWFDTDADPSEVIEAIKDPAGGDTEQAPTSIPSPFARFDLVKTAFFNLSRQKDLRGTPNDERLVSAALDVGELFFNFDKFRNGPLKLIEWDRAKALARLDGGSLAHQRYGKALDLFLTEDAAAYNFAHLRKLYVLYYEGPEGFGYLGGTSPSTLFFASPNELSFVDITFGDARVFDRDRPLPLHERDTDYQEFWHGLKRFTPGFAQLFPEVSEYLTNSLTLLFQNQARRKDWERIGNGGEKIAKEAWEKAFPVLEAGGDNPVELLNLPAGGALRMRKVSAGQDLIQSLSHFLIHSERYTGTPVPMVLRADFTEPLAYTRTPWRDDIPVPNFVAESWRNNQRRLPGQADFYPFLVASDFFEPQLVRLVYPINGRAFFDGGLRGVNKSYLLPLKPEFFEFFSAEELSRGAGVSLSFEERSGGAVKVFLKIPLGRFDAASGKVVATGRTMELSRLYFNDATRQPDEGRNEGVVVEHQFGLTIFPFVRIRDTDPGFKPMYRVHLVDRDVEPNTYKNEFSLRFFGLKNEEISVPAARPRSRKDLRAGKAGSSVTMVEADFERISVEVAGHRGVIVPDFPVKDMGDKTFTFAVDFGTTNTHIEFRTSSGTTPVPFTIDQDSQIATLHDPATANSTALNMLDITGLVPRELMPERLGPEYLHQFPQRTALLENKPNFKENLYGFADMNIGFIYEKEGFKPDEYRVSTNLKWADFSRKPDDAKRIEAFLQSLLLLIRNKVLLNGGDLDQTELLWFYPLSMVENQRNYFERLWNRLFKTYVTEARKPLKVPESIAPFYWYRASLGVSATLRPAVLMDIGGGTTDVVIFEKNEPSLITSVRFAANAIFGDGFSQDGAARRNGFVLRYEEDVKAHLDANSPQLAQANQQIRETNRSEDIVAFYFSLKNNRNLRQKAVYDFNDKLVHDGDLKIAFVVFYGALVYHLAQLMRANAKPMPDRIAFSGTGSKILDILTPKNPPLADLAKLIFEAVYEQPYSETGLDILREPEPKEATSKGGLKMPGLNFTREDDGTLEKKMDDLKTVLWGTTQHRLVTKGDTYQTIDDAVLEDVAAEVRAFVELLFGLDFGFGARFGVNEGRMQEYKSMLLKNLLQNVADGWQLRRETLDNPNARLDETLFFYPLVGALNQLSFAIAQ